MNNNILVGIGGVLVAVVGIWFFASRDQGTSDTDAMQVKRENVVAEQDDTAKAEDTMTPAAESAPMVKGGQYVAYDAAKLSFAKEGNVVLFFRASWCPSCRALDADIRKNLSQVPADVLILDVDYDKSADLKKQYGVTYQHTLVQVDENGAMITKWSGSPELRDLLKEVK